MASIDKIYGNTKQYKELIKFFDDNIKSYREFTNETEVRKYEYEDIEKFTDEFPIVNQSVIADVWLALNCPFEWVIERLKFMYNFEKSSINFKSFMLYELEKDNDRDYLVARKNLIEIEKKWVRVVGLLKKERGY